MITFSPIPSWKDLMRPLGKKPINEAALAEVWCRKGDEAVWSSRASWLLAAIVLWWENSFSKKQPSVWIPSYFPNQALLPLRQVTTNLVFYPVTDNLLPDWQACEILASQNKPDIFVLTHYYSLVSDAKEAKKFCEIHQALLIEDAVHAMVPINDIGERGHIVLYSPHKFFPIPHGSVGIIRPSLQKYVRDLNGTTFHFSAALNLIGNKSPSWILWLIKKTLQKIIGKHLAFRFRKNKLAFTDDPPSDVLEIQPQMSHVAKQLLYSSLNKIPGYIEHRRACPEIWSYLLEQNDIKTNGLFINQESIPYVAVFSFNKNMPAEIYKKLTDKNWPISSWPDLPPEVKAQPDLYRSTINLRNSCLVLPTHQTLNFKELLHRYACLKKAKQSYKLFDANQAAWEDYFCKTPKTNLLQSWFYGDAKANIDKWLPERFVILKDETAIALLQVLRKRFFRLFTVNRINRGPIWLTEKRSSEDLQNVYALIRTQYPWYKRNVLLVAPNLESCAKHQLLLYQQKYRVLNQRKYGSIWLDLSQSEDALRQALRSNWRRQLGGAERKGLFWQEVDVQSELPWLLEKYSEFQNQKGFLGISSALIQKLVEDCHVDSPFRGFLFKAHYENEPVAGILMLRHGLACTYLVVWGGDEKGYNLNATNFLLWNVVLEMKRKGCAWFDMGGISEVTKELAAITSFKRGMSGEEYYLMGEHIAF